MKLSKIIPISLASSAAILAPTLSSCGTPISYTNMLHQYVPGVISYPKTTIDGKTWASELYAQRVKRNPDVFRDDVLYSISSAFNTEAARTEIDKIFTTDMYQFNIFVDDIIANEDGKNVKFDFHFDAGIAGTNKQPTFKIDNKEVKDFQFFITFALLDPIAVSIEDKASPAKAHPELYQVEAELNSMHCEVSMFGSYTYGDGETKTADYEAHDMFIVGTNNPESWTIINQLVFGVNRIAYSVEGSTNFQIVSHYFKDVTINGN